MFLNSIMSTAMHRGPCLFSILVSCSYKKSRHTMKGLGCMLLSLSEESVRSSWSAQQFLQLQTVYSISLQLSSSLIESTAPKSRILLPVLTI